MVPGSNIEGAFFTKTYFVVRAVEVLIGRSPTQATLGMPLNVFKPVFAGHGSFTHQGCIWNLLQSKV